MTESQGLKNVKRMMAAAGHFPTVKVSFFSGERFVGFAFMKGESCAAMRWDILGRLLSRAESKGCVKLSPPGLLFEDGLGETPWEDMAAGSDPIHLAADTVGTGDQE